jgi:acyl-CoA dehydrogenase
MLSRLDLISDQSLVIHSKENNMSVSSWPQSPKGTLKISGTEPRLPEHIGEFQYNLRQFALNEMRPVGHQLDKMTPEQVIAADSPLWDFRKKYLELGINLETLGGLEPKEFALMFPIIFEELGYGDAGLAISMGAGLLPQYLAAKFENQFLLERFPDTMLGCWGITEPDHGSDMLDVSRKIFRPDSNYGRPNCVATIKGDRVIINGQKAAWVSNGTIAEVCILYCAADIGDGPDPRRGAVVVVPMDQEGVSRGNPLDKLGQRALNQGEIYFDNVELSKDYILAGPELYERAVYCIHSEANALMGATFTGVAQSAFDLALDYAHERKQGGAPIIRHQSVASRLFHMYRKVEAARALTRRVVLFNNTEPTPSLLSAMTAKVTATQTSFEVASDALQIFGGNGLTREYPIEKILRDARASMIEDGCNEVLSIKGGYYLVDEEKL